MPVEKNTHPCKVDTPVPDRKNVVYSGTFLSMVMLGVVVIITFLGIYRGHTLIEMLVW